MIRSVALLIVVLSVAPRCVAQSREIAPNIPALSSPTDWRATGGPLVFGGITYYPTGPHVFLNPDIMVRVGTFENVPLYEDATVEAHSIILVPVGGKLLRPYERRRSGELAGTVGSRAPSFPIDLSGERARTAPRTEPLEP